MNKFKKQHSLEKRREESKRITEKYDNRIPLIVLKDTKSNLPDIDRYKFLAPHDITLGQFMYVVRKRIKIDDTETLYFFVNENVLVNTSQSMFTIYNSHKDEDGFLYLTYCSENVFG
jgi:GABA(A) receptor-associated protein